MTTFNQSTCLIGAGLGLCAGGLTGATGAALTGSDVRTTTAILATSTSALCAVTNFSGKANPGGRSNTTFFQAAGILAINEIVSGAIGYGGYRLFIDMSASALPVKEFATSIIPGYCITLGTLSCLQMLYDYYARKTAPAAPRPS